MWEYRIYKTDLGWSIYRKKEIGKLFYMQFMNGHNMRTTNKSYARIFYHREQAVSALIIIKSKDEKKSD